MKKIFCIFSVFLILLVFTIPTFAFTVDFDNPDYVDVFAPSSFKIDNVTVSNSNLAWDSYITVTDHISGDIVSVNIEQPSSGVYFIVEPDSSNTHFTASYDWCYPFTFNPFTEPLPPPNRMLEFGVGYSAEDNINWYVSCQYMYYDFFSGERIIDYYYYNTTLSASDIFELDLTELMRDIRLPNTMPNFIITQLIVDCESPNGVITDISLLTHSDIVEYSYDSLLPDNLTIVQEVVNPNIVEWLVTSLNSFFGVEIFGDITIGNIFGIALAVPLVIWFLKLFAGG